MKDYTLEYLKTHHIPITRENYIGLDFLGDYDPKEMLPAELEAGLPKELQIENKKENNNV
jgi:hypothetical protein